MKEAKHTFPQNSKKYTVKKKKKNQAQTNIFALALSRMKNEVLETVEGPTVLNFLSPQR